VVLANSQKLYNYSNVQGESYQIKQKHLAIAAVAHLVCANWSQVSKISNVIIFAQTSGKSPCKFLGKTLESS
jgi:hypothetical protein